MAVPVMFPFRTFSLNLLKYTLILKGVRVLFFTQVIVQFRQLRAFHLLCSSKGVSADIFCTFFHTFDLSLGFNFEKLRSLLPLKYTGSKRFPSSILVIPTVH